MKWPWSKPKEKKREWWFCYRCGYERVFIDEKPKECPKCGLKGEMRNLQCKYCGATTGEDKRSTCKHSSGAYNYVGG